MTPAEEADALALLRAACEYAGRPWDARVSDVEWMIELHGKRFFACGLDILEGAFADTLLGAVLRRLRKDGWQMNQSIRSACIVFDVWKPEPLGADGLPVSHEGADPDHLILAAGRAMRDSGIISTETKT